MAKKRSTRPSSKAKAPTPERVAVTAERAARLYRLLRLLEPGPKTRNFLTRRLRLDVRGFYRDLKALRDAAIVVVPLPDGRYTLEEVVEQATDRLPFPALLTLGEARQLAKGRTRAHRKLKEQIEAIVR